MKTAVAACLLLTALSVAGCSGAPDAPAAVTTHLTVDYAGAKAKATATVLADLDGRPALTYYTAEHVTHPAFYSAFDQLAQWSQETGTPIHVQHGSFGFYVDGINGLPTDQNHYWSLAVNGTVSEVGMDSVHVAAGSSVSWTLTSLSAGG